MTPEQQAAFESAELYGGGNDELLSCTEPDTYIQEQIFPDYPEDGGELHPVIVVAYRRKAIDPVDVEYTVDGIVELMTERYDEEYGNPEEETSLKMATDGDLHNRIRAIVREYWATSKVWQCEDVARREYSIEEVRAILKGVAK